MNTSANTKQTYEGFLRRGMAGALLAAATTATAVGLAATGHADTGAPPVTADTTATVPSLAAPWLQMAEQFRGYWHFNCGPGVGGQILCQSAWY